MSGDEEDRVPEAYRERWDRLVQIKSHYDPSNFFRLNQNVRPTLLGQNSQQSQGAYSGHQGDEHHYHVFGYPCDQVRCACFP